MACRSGLAIYSIRGLLSFFNAESGYAFLDINIRLVMLN